MQPSDNRTPPSHSTPSLRIYSLLGSVHDFPDLSSVGSTYIYIPIFSRLSRKIQRYGHFFFFLRYSCCVEIVDSYVLDAQVGERGRTRAVV